MSVHKRLAGKIGRWVLDVLPDGATGSARRKPAASVKTEFKIKLASFVARIFNWQRKVQLFCTATNAEKGGASFETEKRALELRRLVRLTAGLSADVRVSPDINDLLVEFQFLHANSSLLKPAFDALQARRVLYCGQCYYNHWYLSRALRLLGWKADVYNWDSNPATQIYYHGEDFKLGVDAPPTQEGEMEFFLASIYGYDIFHFANARGISFGGQIEAALAENFGEFANIRLLRALGKKVIYTNNGCLDGVSQTAFSKWRPEPVCAICRWKNEPSVCCDERNLKWGEFRNSVADYQCLLGGNRVDFNDDPRVHEEPEVYCLSPIFWSPDIEIPERYRLPPLNGGIRLYHAVGHRDERTRDDGVNIKSTHVYLPLIERLRAEGLLLDLIEPSGIPNREVRFLQVQADIFLDMLTYGWFGANVREAMMLAKPVICFIRPEWLRSVREEIPEYVDELPIVSATPHTVEAILRDLIAHPEKRREIGLRSREFALKWHSDSAAGRRFDQIYRALLAGGPLHRCAR